MLISFLLALYLFSQTPSADHFADHLYIPSNIEIYIPLENHEYQIYNATALPQDYSRAIRQDKPTFNLINSFQPGLFESEIWINPGEAGSIYLKAYEVTKNTPLSSYQLKKNTFKKITWSSDPKELFHANSSFTIYEGDWGKPYAARFEIWFISDSEKNERKLLDKTFQIEGWQR